MIWRFTPVVTGGGGWGYIELQILELGGGPPFITTFPLPAQAFFALAGITFYGSANPGPGEWYIPQADTSAELDDMFNSIKQLVINTPYFKNNYNWVEAPSRTIRAKAKFDGATYVGGFVDGTGGNLGFNSGTPADKYDAESVAGAGCYVDVFVFSDAAERAKFPACDASPASDRFEATTRLEKRFTAILPFADFDYVFDIHGVLRPFLWATQPTDFTQAALLNPCPGQVVRYIVAAGTFEDKFGGRAYNEIAYYGADGTQGFHAYFAAEKQSVVHEALSDNAAVRVNNYRLSPTPPFVPVSFLTRQPLVKRTTRRAHEFLYFFTPADPVEGQDNTVRMAYNLVFEDGSSYLGSDALTAANTVIPAGFGGAWWADVSLSRIEVDQAATIEDIETVAGKRVRYWYVYFVDDNNGTRTVRHHYELDEDRCRPQVELYALNPIGGFDTVSVMGRVVRNNSAEYGSLNKTAEYVDNSQVGNSLRGTRGNFGNKTTVVYTLNLGYQTPEEAEWIRSLLNSNELYLRDEAYLNEWSLTSPTYDRNFEPCVVTGAAWSGSEDEPQNITITVEVQRDNTIAK
jgi:hypothetical protein